MPECFRRIVIVLALSALCALQACRYPPAPVSPPPKLTGGTRLVFSVAITPSSPPNALIDTAHILQQRIDPDHSQGVQVNPLTSGGIEVLIPPQPPQAASLRKAFEAALPAALAPSCTRADLERIAALPENQRSEHIARLAGSDIDRQDRLQRAVANLAALNTATAAHQSAAKFVSELRQLVRNTGNGPAATELNAKLAAAEAEEAALRKAAAAAAITEEDAEKLIISEGIDEPALRRIFELSDSPLRLPDRSKKLVNVPSLRQQSLDALAKKFPHKAAALHDAAAKWAAYEDATTGIDDLAVIDLMHQPGELTFRIAVAAGELPGADDLLAQLRSGGPSSVHSDEATFFPVRDITTWLSTAEDLQALTDSPREYFARRALIAETYRGTPYILCWNKRGLRLTRAPEDGAWEVTKAYEGRDTLGRKAIDFQLDVMGASKLGSLTSANVSRTMAVLLDDQVCTAPVLQSRITSQGQITGSFTKREIDTLVNIMGTQRLPAKVNTEPTTREIIEK